MTVRQFDRGAMVRRDNVEDIDDAKYTELKMTQAEKDGHIGMLNEAERAALKAISRVAADSGVELVAEHRKVVEIFFHMRDRINSAPLTKED